MPPTKHIHQYTHTYTKLRSTQITLRNCKTSQGLPSQFPKVWHGLNLPQRYQHFSQTSAFRCQAPSLLSVMLLPCYWLALFVASIAAVETRIWPFHVLYNINMLFEYASAQVCVCVRGRERVFVTVPLKWRRGNCRAFECCLITANQAPDHIVIATQVVYYECCYNNTRVSTQHVKCSCSGAF